ncbi:MAG: cation diffusion facilitator family transporter [Bacilli bacterium]|nr:cation diffusion facilitator family transporter [Bacilli bacterium]
MFNKMNREKKIITTSFIGVGGNILLVALKATIGLLANSISIIMDAINNLSDALSSVITIIGTKLAGKKPDKKHPYGHGRVEYLTSLVIAVIILVAGIMAIYESIMALVNHETPTYNNISLIVVSIGIVIKVILGLFFKKMGKETHSDALSGSGLDALFDALLSAGTLVGALVAMFANVYIEGYIGILIGLFIIKSGIGVLMESVSNIIGQRANSEITNGIKELVASFPGVKGVYDLILNNYGPNRVIGSVHIEVDDKMTAKEIHPLTRAISGEAYLKYGVILTVGIYASYNDYPEYTVIRDDVFKKVKEYKEIKEIHAFYIDKDNKIINFDLVIHFGKDIDPQQIIASIEAYIKEKYPEYQVIIVQDNDFSD